MVWRPVWKATTVKQDQEEEPGSLEVALSGEPAPVWGVDRGCHYHNWRRPHEWSWMGLLRGRNLTVKCL